MAEVDDRGQSSDEGRQKGHRSFVPRWRQRTGPGDTPEAGEGPGVHPNLQKASETAPSGKRFQPRWRQRAEEIAAKEREQQQNQPSTQEQVDRLGFQPRWRRTTGPAAAPESGPVAPPESAARTEPPVDPSKRRFQPKWRQRAQADIAAEAGPAAEAAAAESAAQTAAGGRRFDPRWRRIAAAGEAVPPAEAAAAAADPDAAPPSAPNASAESTAIPGVAPTPGPSPSPITGATVGPSAALAAHLRARRNRFRIEPAEAEVPADPVAGPPAPEVVAEVPVPDGQVVTPLEIVLDSPAVLPAESPQPVEEPVRLALVVAPEPEPRSEPAFAPLDDRVELPGSGAQTSSFPPPELGLELQPTRVVEELPSPSPPPGPTPGEVPVDAPLAPAAGSALELAGPVVRPEPAAPMTDLFAPADEAAPAWLLEGGDDQGAPAPPPPPRPISLLRALPTVDHAEPASEGQAAEHPATPEVPPAPAVVPEPPAAPVPPAMGVVAGPPGAAPDPPEAPAEPNVAPISAGQPVSKALPRPTAPPPATPRYKNPVLKSAETALPSRPFLPGPGAEAQTPHVGPPVVPVTRKMPVVTADTPRPVPPAPPSLPRERISPYVAAPTALPPARAEVEKRRAWFVSGRERGVPAQDVATFTRQLSVMIGAGLPLHQALNFFAESSEGPLAKVVDGLATKISSGYRLSAALAESPAIFSDVYVGLMELGETTSHIDEALERLADLLEKQVNLSKRLSAALVYPLFLILVCAASIAVFLQYVLPTMVPLFQSFSMELPWPTRVLIASRHAVAPGVIAVLCGFAFWTWFKPRWQRGRRVRTKWALDLDRFLLRLPLLGKFLLQMSTARVLFALATMLETGLPLLNALKRCESVAANAEVARRLEAAGGSLREGGTITEAMHEHDVLPPACIHLLAAGEESAHLAEMVQYAARFYEEEVDHSIDQFMSLVEPIIMVVMGMVVAFIVLSAVLPTVQMISQLGV